MMHTGPFGPNQTTEDPPDPVVFVKSLEYPGGLQFRGTIPNHIDRSSPNIKMPAFPETRASSLQIMQPCSLFVQFSCPERCRSFGICVHYQFLLGCRRCPDGLVCEKCHEAGIEKAIKVERVCPLHQDAARPKPISSRPEDFLGSKEQRQASNEIFRRSLQNDWDDLKEGRQTDALDEETLGRNQRDQTPKTLEDLRGAGMECQLEAPMMSLPHNFSTPTLPTIQEWVMTQQRQNTW